MIKNLQLTAIMVTYLFIEILRLVKDAVCEGRSP